MSRERKDTPLHPEDRGEGAGSTLAGPHDMSKPRDREDVRRACIADSYEALANKRPATYLQALDVSLSDVMRKRTVTDTEGNEKEVYVVETHRRVREVRGIMRCLIAIVGQVQAQEFLNLKYDRIDHGKGTELVELSGEEREELSRLAGRIDTIDTSRLTGTRVSSNGTKNGETT